MEYRLPLAKFALIKSNARSGPVDCLTRGGEVKKRCIGTDNALLTKAFKPTGLVFEQNEFTKLSGHRMMLPRNMRVYLHGEHDEEVAENQKNVALEMGLLELASRDGFGINLDDPPFEPSGTMWNALTNLSGLKVHVRLIGKWDKEEIEHAMTHLTKLKGTLSVSSGYIDCTHNIVGQEDIVETNFTVVTSKWQKLSKAVKLSTIAKHLNSS